MQINPDWPEVYRTVLLNITATSNAEHVDKLMTEIELTAAEVDAIKTAQNNRKDKTVLATLCVWSQRQLVIDLNRLQKLARKVGLSVNQDCTGLFPKLPTDNGLDDTELAAIAIATRKSKESNQLGASGTVSNAAPTIPITTSSQPCQIEQFPKITIGDTAILKPWSPSGAQSMAKDAPDPLRAPTPFLHWLNQMCTIYSPLPGDLLIILKLAYGSKWQLVRELFHVPQRAEWGSEERGNNISLDIWLDTVCERVVKAEASSQADFSIVTQTIQKPDEAPVEFSQRFRHMGGKRWNNNGLKYDVYCTNVYKLP